MSNAPNEEKRYDFIVVGAGAAGSVLAAELSASGAHRDALQRDVPREARAKGPVPRDANASGSYQALFVTPCTDFQRLCFEL